MITETQRDVIGRIVEDDSDNPDFYMRVALVGCAKLMTYIAERDRMLEADFPTIRTAFHSVGALAGLALDLQKLNTMPYAEYLQSPQWQAIRAEKKAFSPVCEVCGCADNLHVHHLTYERRGWEQQGDLRTLCADCHAQEHGLTS